MKQTADTNLSTEGTRLKRFGGILPPKILKLSAAQKCYFTHCLRDISKKKCQEY